MERVLPDVFDERTAIRFLQQFGHKLFEELAKEVGNTVADCLDVACYNRAQDVKDVPRPDLAESEYMPLHLIRDDDESFEWCMFCCDFV